MLCTRILFTVLQPQGRCDAPEVVAVKCLSKKTLNKVTVDRLLTEITLMKEELKHPHIVQMVDFLVRFIISPTVYCIVYSTVG